MMHGFRRRRGQLTCTFEDTELTILCSLTKTLLQLLRSDAMPPVRASSWNDSSDCSPEALFAELENQMGCEVKADFATNPEVDPVLRRLFPMPTATTRAPPPSSAASARPPSVTRSSTRPLPCCPI
ncbi:DUF2017 family protein [Propionibacterium freudenreichii]|nr:DUF2017 family protein [Propionibacterium freudenreichii]